MTGYFRRFFLVWPLLALKIFIFYWQTDRLDMMDVYEVPLLTALQIVSQNDNIKLGMVKQFIIRNVRRRRGAVQTVPIRLSVACRIARKSGIF